MNKQIIDAYGILLLTGFSFLLACNQIIVKLTISGFQPVFSASLRSLLASLFLCLFMYLRGVPLLPKRGNVKSAILLGFLFAIEFLLLFEALDRTTVSRASVMFYTMPVWLAIAGHFLLPNEKLSYVRCIGLALAVTGVIFAFFDFNLKHGHASLIGDLFAIGASIMWAGIALCARLTSISQEKPETQLLMQLIISAPLLFAASFLFGPFIRDLSLTHWSGLICQSLIASFGFLIWFRLIGVYKTTAVASFSFLAPILSVFLGWFILSENAGWNLLAALVFVTIGMVLINRK